MACLLCIFTPVLILLLTHNLLNNNNNIEMQVQCQTKIKTVNYFAASKNQKNVEKSKNAFYGIKDIFTEFPVYNENPERKPCPKISNKTAY